MTTQRMYAGMVLALSLFPFLGGAAVAAGHSGGLLSAISNTSAEADKYRSLMSNMSVGQFQLVNVTAALAPGDETAYRNALKKNAAALADLRDTMSHTTLTDAQGVITTLRKVLAAKAVTIAQVVGVYVDSGDRITIYYE